MHLVAKGERFGSRLSISAKKLHSGRTNPLRSSIFVHCLRSGVISTCFLKNIYDLFTFSDQHFYIRSKFLHSVKFVTFGWRNFVTECKNSTFWMLKQSTDVEPRWGGRKPETESMYRMMYTQRRVVALRIANAELVFGVFGWAGEGREKLETPGFSVSPHHTGSSIVGM